MENGWNPSDLLQLSGDYWRTCALHAGVKLDVFTHLADRSSNAAELADRLEVDQRGLAMLLNALAALGLLQKKDDSFAATPFALQFLSRSSQDYLGYIILHHHHLMESWARLDSAVRKGGPVRERSSHDVGEDERESFLMGMFNLAMRLAPIVVPRIDLEGRKRLLDLGGGPGTYAIHFCRNNPEINAVIYDLPTTRSFAEKTIARFGLSERIEFSPGDFMSEGIPGKFDVVWISQVLHAEGPEGCTVILDKAIAAMEPGGMILVQEFILDDSMDRPLFPALFSLNMLIGTPSGKAYSQGELSAMLVEAGAINVRRLPLDLPDGVGIITGTKPISV